MGSAGPRAGEHEAWQREQRQSREVEHARGSLEVLAQPRAGAALVRTAEPGAGARSMEGGKVSSSNRAGRRASRSSTPQGSSPMSSASAAAAASAAASSTSSSRSQVASKRRHASLSPKSRQPSAAGAVPADKPAGPTANGLSAAPSSLALAAPKRRGAGNKGGSSSCMGACLRLVSVTFILVFFTLLTSVDLIAKGLVLRQRRGSDGTFSGFSRSLLTGADLPGGASDWAGTASNGSSSAGSQRGQDGGEGSAELEEQLRQSDVRQAEGESEGETGGSERSEGIGGGVGGASGLQLPKLEQQWEEKRVRSWFGESGGGSTGDGGAGEQSQSVDALLEERVDAALSAVQERHKALNSQPFQLHILVSMPLSLPLQLAQPRQGSPSGSTRADCRLTLLGPTCADCLLPRVSALCLHGTPCLSDLLWGPQSIRGGRAGLDSRAPGEEGQAWTTEHLGRRAGLDR